MWNKYRRKQVLKMVQRMGMLAVFAFLIWAGTELLMEDGKNQQLEDFQVSNEAFRRISIGEKRFLELKQISEQTGLPFEKLLAVSFLRNYFYEASFETAPVLITELAAYERRNPPAFRSISRFYKKMISPVSVFPLPYIKEESKDAEIPWTSVCFDENAWEVCFTVDEKWAEILPVFNMEDGTVYDIDEEEKTIRIKGENGILYAFRNLETGSAQWKAGDKIAAGEVIGRAGYSEEDKKTVKLQLQFLLPSKEDVWFPYNGLWSVLDEEIIHYTVRQKLP